nr:hypothetical protein [Tanacetum cinerariifolium]
MASKIEAQDLEISNLKAMIKILEEKDRGSAEPSRDDAPIKGRSMEIGEEARVERSTELGTVSVPSVAGVSTVGVPTIDAQVAKEIKEEIAREDQRMNERLARDAKISRLHAKDEIKMMIEEKIELINELVKYQDHHAKILKYQAQQSKPLFKKEQREFYMSVLRSHARWKTRHFREEGERVKRKGLKLKQGSAKKMKTSEEVSKEDLKEMMQLVPVEEVYVEALLGGHTAVYQFFVDMLKQLDREDLHQLWALVKETLSIRHASCDKEKELWVELKILFKPDFKDQLWTHTQYLMHDPLDWK